MTLIDSRPGIKAAFEALTALTGVYVDADLAVTRLGPPLAEELAHWFPAEDIPAVAETYRNEIYPVHAISGTPAMPGAREAVAAIHRAGGRAVVVTAKYGRNAVRHLEHLGIEADAVIGDLWAEGKGAALIEYGASVYVGDHIGDVRGARTAGALSVGVATGPVGAADLRAAGADVVLTDLTEFPEWFAGYLPEAA
jgi:phosphoglycolate phosphatase